MTSQVKPGYYYQLYRQVSLGGKVKASGDEEVVRSYVARQYLAQTDAQNLVSLFLDKDGELVDLNAQFDPTGEWLPKLMFAGHVPEGMEYDPWEQYCRHALYLFYNMEGVPEAFLALPFNRYYFDENDREVDEVEALEM